MLTYFSTITHDDLDICNMSENELVLELCEEFWQWRLRTWPEYATYIGFQVYSDGLDPYTEKQYHELKEYCEKLLQRLNKIDPERCNHENQINIDLLQHHLETFITGIPYKTYLWPINFHEGLHSHKDGLQKIIEKTKFNTVDDYENYIKRLEKFRNQVSDLITCLQKAISLGMLPHTAGVVNLPSALDTLIIPPVEESLFYQPFKQIPENIPDGKRDELQRKGRELVKTNVQESYAELKEFVEKEWVSRARGIPSYSTLPNGYELYCALMRFHSETDLSPDEVFRLGQEELAKVQGKIKELMKKENFQGSYQEFKDFLSERMKQDLPETQEEIFDMFRQTIKKIETKLPQFFNVTTDLPLGIEPIPTKQKVAMAFYQGPTHDGKIPGTLFIDTDTPDFFYTMSLMLHEITPGHHLQHCVVVKHKSVPAFRLYKDDRMYCRAPARFPMNTAYTEGWGLYCEELGIEMGLYDDIVSLFGYYCGELYRACRLMVNIGIHVYGWTWEEAAKYLQENTALHEAHIESELLRHCTWPGQQCSYKIGHFKFRELRKKAEKELGDHFDIREFHNACLWCGQVPLKCLEKIIDNFIREEKKKHGIK